MVTAEALGAVVRAMWHRRVAECTEVTRSLWRLRVAPEPADLVAKWVPAARRGRLLGGLVVARHLAAQGVETGAPVSAADGSFCVPFDDGILALLRQVPGRPLAATDPIDQQFFGDMLGTVHRVLVGFTHPQLIRLGRLDVGGAHLGLTPWLRPAVADATAALVRLTVTDQLSYGVVHGDPDPGAFRIDRATGRLGLVGWGWAATGLLLYDVAGAVGYLGGIAAATEFLDGYLSVSPMHPGEIAAGLPIVLRCRLARRADTLARGLFDGSSRDPSADWAALDEVGEQLATAPN